MRHWTEDQLAILKDKRNATQDIAHALGVPIQTIQRKRRELLGKNWRHCKPSKKKLGARRLRILFSDRPHNEIAKLIGIKGHEVEAYRERFKFLEKDFRN